MRTSGHADDDLTGRAVYATWWSALEIIARYSTQFLVMIVLARLLVPNDFGLMALLLVFTSVGGLLVDSGFGAALIQRQRQNNDDETTVFVFTTCMGVAMYVAIWLAAPGIASFFAEPRLEPLARFMGLVLPLSALAVVPDAFLTMRLEFRKRAGAELIASLVAAIVTMLLAWQGAGVWSLAWQAVIAIVIRVVLLWLYSGWRPRGHFRVSSFRVLFGFGGFVFLSNLLEVVSLRLQSLLIGKLYDPRILGYYALAQNTQQVPVSFAASVLNRVGLPVFSTVSMERQKLLNALRLSLRVSMFLFLPCMAGIAVIATPLVRLLYGAQWEPAGPVLSVLSLAGALWPMHVLNLAAVNALGRSDLFFNLAVVKKVVGIVLIVVGSHWGVMGVAYSVLLGSLFSAVVNTHYSRKLMGYGMREQLGDLKGPLTVTLAAAIAGWLVLHASPNGPLGTAMAIVSAAGCYALMSALTRQPALAELIELWRRLRAQSTSSPGVSR